MRVERHWSTSPRRPIRRGTARRLSVSLGETIAVPLQAANQRRAKCSLTITDFGMVSRGGDGAELAFLMRYFYCHVVRKEAAMDTKEGRYYRALYEVALAINSSLDPQEVMRAIAESTAGAMGAKGASLILLSPDRKELYHSAAYGLSDWYVRKGRMQVDDSMNSSLAGRAVAIRDVSTDPRVQYRAQAVQEGIASMLSVPIRLRGAVIGLVRIYTGTPRDFSPDEVEFVDGVASLGAVALANARRYAEAKADYEGVRQDLLEWYDAWGIERSADALAGGVASAEDAA